MDVQHITPQINNVDILLPYTILYNKYVFSSVFMNNRGRDALEVAERLADEQRNVNFFAFGVGRGVDKTELLPLLHVGSKDDTGVIHFIKLLITFSGSPFLRASKR